MLVGCFRLLNRELDLGEVFVGGLFVPGAVDVGHAHGSDDGKVVGVDVFEDFHYRYAKRGVGSGVAVAECARDGRRLVEMEDGCVGTHGVDSLAVFDVDVLVVVLIAMLYGVAVLRLGAQTAHAHHLGTNLGVAQRSEVVPSVDGCAMARHGAGGN